MADKYFTRGWSIEAKLAFYSDFLPCQCHVWCGAKSKSGYGKTTYEGRDRYVHNVAWEVFRGPIPEGLHVLHDCPAGDNPSCWNPEHLWLGTKSANIADRDAKGRQAKGERVAGSKLTEGQVIAIRSDARFLQVLSKEYRASESTISDIKRRITWRHV